MKTKLSCIVGLFCLLQTSLFCRPLSLVNATPEEVTLLIMIKGVQEPTLLTIPVHGGTTYDSGNATITRIAWSGYGKKGTEDEHTAHIYIINTGKVMPEMAEGGALVISSGGEYLYDNKRGGQYGVKFGVATINDI